MDTFNHAVDNSSSDDEIVIDLGRIFFELRKYWKFIVILAAVCGLIAFSISSFFMTEQYESRAKIYLKPEMRQDAAGIDYSSINANKMMVNNYMAMLKGDTLMGEVAEKVGGDHSKQSIKNCITVSNADDTEVIDVVAVTDNAQESQKIVKTTISAFSAQMKKELDVKNILIIDKASLNEVPVSPNVLKNTVLGIMLGIIAALGIVAVKVILDKRLRTKEEVENYLGIPVLASIPYREI